MCAAAQLTAVEPLWGEPTPDLYREFVATGADARLVTVRDRFFDADWLGRPLTLDLLPEFDDRGVDACGECGECPHGGRERAALRTSAGRRVQDARAARGLLGGGRRGAMRCSCGVTPVR